MPDAAIDAAAIRKLVPHSGAMCLLDSVIGWDETHIHARSDSHRNPDHPLRSDGQLSSVHLIEYGAQATAVHGALIAQAHDAPFEPKLLVSVRNVDLHVSRIDNIDATLDIHATRLIGNAQGTIYRFAIQAGGRELAQGQVSLYNNSRTVSGGRPSRA